MYKTNDNIVALATAPGRSALNVVRCSGFSVLDVLKKISPSSFRPKANRCDVLFIKNPKTKEVVDQCVVSVFLAPKSFTGENVVEFSVHGGVVVSKKLIAVLVDCGCRIASPGEFSYRAFINGKIDLIQAEAIALIVDSKKTLPAAYSMKNLHGELSSSLMSLRKKMIDVITYMEHELDFNEGEIDFKDFNVYIKQLNLIKKDVFLLKNSALVGLSGFSDINVCIVGKTNVGKSSLFNCLSGYDRSIVSNVPGTTRDTVELTYPSDDLNINLIDTAGLRKKAGKIESFGIKRALDTIDASNIILFVDDFDPQQAIKGFGLSLLNKKIVYVQNKIDKNKKINNKNVFCVSCLKKTGIKRLSTHLQTIVSSFHSHFLEKNDFLISERVSVILEKFLFSFEEPVLLLKNKEDLTVVVSSLYVCLDLISSTTSSVDKNEVVENIFGGFCVGK